MGHMVCLLACLHVFVFVHQPVFDHWQQCVHLFRSVVHIVVLPKYEIHSLTLQDPYSQTTLVISRHRVVCKGRALVAHKLPAERLAIDHHTQAVQFLVRKTTSPNDTEYPSGQHLVYLGSLKGDTLDTTHTEQV